MSNTPENVGEDVDEEEAFFIWIIFLGYNAWPWRDKNLATTVL